MKKLLAAGSLVALSATGAMADGTFADTLVTSANIPNLVTNQQTMLTAAIVIPFGFVAYKLIKKVLGRVG